MVGIFCRLWYNCGQTKNHRRIGGDFSRNGGPKGIRTLDLSDANRTLSQLSYGPISPLFAGFCNKKQVFKFFDFRRFRRKITPKSWAETHRSMCGHRDANRTLSQLSYKPIITLSLYTSCGKMQELFPGSFRCVFSIANAQYKYFIFHLCRIRAILYLLRSDKRCVA